MYPSLMAIQAPSTTTPSVLSISNNIMNALSSVIKAPALRKRRVKDVPSSLADLTDTVDTDASASDESVERNEIREQPRTKKRKVDSASAVSVSSTVANAAKVTAEVPYLPRRSKRLSNHPIAKIEGDGDTWIEILVINVKDRKKKKNKTRSLFYSMATQNGMLETCIVHFVCT
jgi:hypothetical protein